MAEATCEKCDKYYEDPRMLPCLHSFCLGCLQKELDTHATLNCPNCKEQVILPENGLSGLPQDLRKANEAELERISEKVEEADEQCEIAGELTVREKRSRTASSVRSTSVSFAKGDTVKIKLQQTTIWSRLARDWSKPMKRPRPQGFSKRNCLAHATRVNRFRPTA